MWSVALTEHFACAKHMVYMYMGFNNKSSSEFVHSLFIIFSNTCQLVCHGPGLWDISAQLKAMTKTRNMENLCILLFHPAVSWYSGFLSRADAHKVHDT